MKAKKTIKQQITQKARYYTHSAYKATLKSGQPVLEIVDGNLVETSPDGSKRVLKKAAPTYRLPKGKVLKVT